jgi:hypothetical protein
LKLFGKKLHSVEVNRPVADLSADSNRFIRAWIFELNLNVASNREVGGSKQADATFTESHATSMDHRLVGGMVDHYPKLCVKRVALPAASIWLLLHDSNFSACVADGYRYTSLHGFFEWLRYLESIANALVKIGY